jgi:cation transport regulator ChaC
LSAIKGPADVGTGWGFGYGSLIRNPEFDLEQSERARLQG